MDTNVDPTAVDTPTEPHYGTGRRKTSTARVFLRSGSGTITVNRIPLEQGFPIASVRKQITEPLQLTEVADKIDVFATTTGGGFAGQAGALRLGIARALVQYTLNFDHHSRKLDY